MNEPRYMLRLAVALPARRKPGTLPPGPDGVDLDYRAARRELVEIVSAVLRTCRVYGYDRPEVEGRVSVEDAAPSDRPGVVAMSEENPP